MKNLNPNPRSSGIKVGPPLLLVRDIDRVLKFYEEELDLQMNEKTQANNDSPVYELNFKHHLSSSLKSPLLMLQQEPNARTAPPYSAGLYHFAILLPDRKSLASTYLRLKDLGVKFDGFADHLVSESLYLRDSENNGIEIYRDRPAEEWPRDASGRIIMDTLPLNFGSLLSEIYGDGASGVEAFPTGGRIGHIHLKVTNLKRSIGFYHEKLGLDITVDWSSMGAAFLSSGGYHHHIGINTWQSLDGESRRNDEAGLKNFTITIPDMPTFKTIKSIFTHGSISEEQIKQTTKDNQFLVSDSDGIQIIIIGE